MVSFLSSGVYDPGKVKLVYGVLPISGFADGAMIELTPLGEGVKILQGTTGETCFIETPDRRFSLTFRLYATNTLMNTALTSLVNAASLPLPVVLTSLSTGEIMIAATGRIERIPGVIYDGSIPVREWKILIPRLDQQTVPVSF